MTTKHITPQMIKERKGAAPVVCLTSYTAPMATMQDDHADLLLVGDSLAMVLYGMDSTVGIDLDTMIRHGQAVTRGSSRACIVVDLPAGSYEDSDQQALESGLRVIRETGADAVKLEGGVEMASRIRTLVENGVEVMAHIGLMPQSVEKEGGYKIKGKTEADATRLIGDIKAVEAAGAFSVVIEGTIADVATRLTAETGLPTIGIGASAACDGQILVTEDMIGMNTGHVPKFVRKFVDVQPVLRQAFADYAEAVSDRSFPAAEHTYTVKKVAS